MMEKLTANDSPIDACKKCIEIESKLDEIIDIMTNCRIFGLRDEFKWIHRHLDEIEKIMKKN